MRKADRQKKIVEIILKDNKGWKQAELARILKVHRSTIGRDLVEMVKKLPIQEENGRLYLDSSTYQSNLQFNLHEILALHHASKTMAQHSTLEAFHLSSALQKMAKSVSIHSPEIGQLMKESSRDIKKTCDNSYKKQIRNLERLNQAWMENRKLQLRYTPMLGEALAKEVFHLSCLETEREGDLMLRGKINGNDQEIPFNSIHSVKVLQEA